MQKRVNVAVREGTPAGPLITARAILEAAEECVAIEVWHFRRGGATWADVGRHLGVTKQAAQQKYGTKKQARSTDLPPTLDGLDN